MGKQKVESFFFVDDFRPIIQSWAKARGRGEFRRISLSLGMHTTLVSQIVNGRKNLTEEQASRLCSYMGLTTLESDYFLKLVQIDRAGTEELRSIYRRQLMQLRMQANEAKNWVPATEELSDSDRAIYYSSWQYSLVRLITSIDHFQTVESISLYLKLSPSRVREILDFLVSRGLCKECPSGRYARTGKNTHIEANSPLSIRHHQNWRAKSLDFHEKMSPTDLAFTAPISISKKDFSRVRSILLNTISEIAKIVEASPSEETAYLGIDWFKI